ncbi:GGDEF domain-containing protein, partial [Klebsiella michiganensis]|uniref:GGDEF domain-containing protein n=1 Tax=Klebsiella michiganensis TaxID=1134687 RepID=UPI00311D3D2A
RIRPHSTIDVWLLVVLCVWACDVALSTVFNAGRYDLGFYLGRACGLMAGSFVLLLLLVENSVLHSRLAAAMAELRRVATTDPLTGVANRRSFETGLNQEWRRSARAGTPLALLMIDVDCCKAYNDCYG